MENREIYGPCSAHGSTSAINRNGGESNSIDGFSS